MRNEIIQAREMGYMNGISPQKAISVKAYVVAGIIWCYIYKNQFREKHPPSSSVPYLTWMHGYLRAYATWANKENHFNEMTSTMLQTCINKEKERSKIVLRGTLMESVKTFNNAYEKALVVGLFEGIRISDFDKLEKAHLEGNIVHIPDRGDLKVSDELAEYLRLAADTFEVYQKSSDPRFQSDRYTKLDKTDERIIKSTQYAPKADRTIRMRVILEKCINEYGFPWISATELPQSGAANMLLELVEKNRGKSVEQVVKENIEEIRYRYGSSWVYKARFKEKYGYLLSSPKGGFKKYTNREAI